MSFLASQATQQSVLAQAVLSGSLSCGKFSSFFRTKSSLALFLMVFEVVIDHLSSTTTSTVHTNWFLWQANFCGNYSQSLRKMYNNQLNLIALLICT